MNNRGQYLPFGRWMMALILMFILYVSYAFFAPLIDTIIPNGLINTPGNHQYQNEVTASTQSSFLIGMIGLGLGYLFYAFIGGLPGNQEEYPR